MIKDNILRINERVADICSQRGLNPKEVVVIAVSKGRSVEQVIEAVRSGIVNIGENRVQEARDKYAAIRNIQALPKIAWHMIGHLQTNKAGEAVEIFDLIHSVDSLKLAKELDKEAAELNKIQNILIQVNTSAESTKSGVRPQDALRLLEEVSQFKNLDIQGLMTIGPLTGDAKDVRFCFASLKKLLDDSNTRHITKNAMRILSMGMSDDFELALEEGSNMVRLGRIIFERPQ